MQGMVSRLKKQQEKYVLKKTRRNFIIPLIAMVKQKKQVTKKSKSSSLLSSKYFKTSLKISCSINVLGEIKIVKNGSIVPTDIASAKEPKNIKITNKKNCFFLLKSRKFHISNNILNIDFFCMIDKMFIV